MSGGRDTGTVAVIGAGSWGSALAVCLAQEGREVRLWARRAEQRAELRAGTNEAFLPGTPLPASIQIVDEATEAIRDAEVVLIAVPSSAIAPTLQDARAALPEGSNVVALAKGFERSRGRRLSEVMSEILPGGSEDVAVLLGPSHAEEVAAGHPTAIVLAGSVDGRRERLQSILSTSSFRLYTNEDLVGVETAAALKNVLAIAAGICDGLGLGDNTKGALLTRGVAEIARLGVALGGRRETFFGLSGIGDVITTCLSRHSRNRALGEHVGRGESLESSLRAVVQVVEGVETTRTAHHLAQEHQVSMPITGEVHRVLFENKAPAEAIAGLMRRSLKSEWEESPSLGRQQ